MEHSKNNRPRDKTERVNTLKVPADGQVSPVNYEDKKEESAVGKADDSGRLQGFRSQMKQSRDTPQLRIADTPESVHNEINRKRRQSLSRAPDNSMAVSAENLENPMTGGIAPNENPGANNYRPPPEPSDGDSGTGTDKRLELPQSETWLHLPYSDVNTPTSESPPPISSDTPSDNSGDSLNKHMQINAAAGGTPMELPPSNAIGTFPNISGDGLKKYEEESHNAGGINKGASRQPDLLKKASLNNKRSDTISLRDNSRYGTGDSHFPSSHDADSIETKLRFGRPAVERSPDTAVRAQHNTAYNKRFLKEPPKIPETGHDFDKPIITEPAKRFNVPDSINISGFENTAHLPAPETSGFIPDTPEQSLPEANAENPTEVEQQEQPQSSIFSHEKTISHTPSERATRPLHDRIGRLHFGDKKISAPDSSLRRKLPPDGVKQKENIVSYAVPNKVEKNETPFSVEPTVESDAIMDSAVGFFNEGIKPNPVYLELVATASMTSSSVSRPVQDSHQPAPPAITADSYNGGSVHMSYESSASEKLADTAASPADENKSSKLRFNKDEDGGDALSGRIAAGKNAGRKRGIPNRPEVKPDNATEKSPDKVIETKPDKTSNNHPGKSNIPNTRSAGEGSGKTKRGLRFEDDAKNQPKSIKAPLVTQPVKLSMNAALSYGHRKLYQVEDENVGTKAAHKAETTAENMLRSAYRQRRRRKTAQRHTSARAEHKSPRLNTGKTNRRPSSGNPRLQSNIFSRAAQKRGIKKQYANKLRGAKNTARNTKNAAAAVNTVVKAVVSTVTKNPAVFGVIAGLVLLLILISSMVTACSNMASGIGSSVYTMSYLAEDADVDNAELFYTGLETDLRESINGIQNDYPGYDEYRIDCPTEDIGHDPYDLMAYLTALYQDFNYYDVESVLRGIFNGQYQLTVTPSVETRYYEDEDGELVPYDWNVLTAVLTARPFTEVIYSDMDETQRQHYEMLMQSKGGRQYAGSPFSFDWLPHVSSGYGYRVHPISGERDYHKGIDIAVSSGTEILAAQDGTVTFSGYMSSYGNIVVIENAEGLVTKYAHCESTLVSAGQTVKAGDVIAKVGSTGNSTGPHLHFEVIKEGIYLNPAYFSLAEGSGSAPDEAD